MLHSYKKHTVRTHVYGYVKVKITLTDTHTYAVRTCNIDLYTEYSSTDFYSRFSVIINMYRRLVIFVLLIFCGLGSLDNFVGLYFCDVPTLIT